MGMTVLLDTHVVLWALMEPHRISRRARRVVEDADNTLLVSSASAWEIATKHRLGRLPEAEGLVHGYGAHLRALGAKELAVTWAHGIVAGALRQSHRDLFDRMLAAQSMVEGVTLITRDGAFKSFRIPLLW